MTVARVWAPLAAIGALLLFAPPAEAQKVCRKGIPCGNTCISARKTCHVGSGDATAAEPRASTAASVSQPDTANASAPWVASSRGSTYYRNACSGARRLSSANRIYFATEDQAQGAGYRRSRTDGC
jgi:hypothetical protein